MAFWFFIFLLEGWGEGEVVVVVVGLVGYGVDGG